MKFEFSKGTYIFSNIYLPFKQKSQNYIRKLLLYPLFNVYYGKMGMYTEIGQEKKQQKTDKIK